MPDMVSTRQVPKRSATAPKTGCPKPQMRFWMAIARPKVVRSQPLSSSMGSWKRPIAERGPKVMAAMMQPLMMISQGNVGSEERAGVVETTMKETLQFGAKIAEAVVY